MGGFVKLFLSMFLLIPVAMSRQGSKELAPNKLEPSWDPVTLSAAHETIPGLNQFELEKSSLAAATNNNDPDGCCIQWVPGQAKGCSQTKQKQCKEDADAVNAKWSWHAGACTDADGCH